jgi:hypothetical protein
MFFFKKKKIVVDTFTHMNNVYEYFPIDNALKYTPDWWKKLPGTYEEVNAFGVKMPTSTIKHCEGFIDLYKSGFIIPLWSDLIVSTKDDGAWQYQWADFKAYVIQSHSERQYSQDLNKYIHLKLQSPWAIKEKTGVKFVWTEPLWNNLLNTYDIKLLPGILDFKYQSSSHVNIFLQKKEQSFNINCGTPMVHLIPMSEHNVEIKNHLISTDEYNQLKDLDQPFTFTGKYRKVKKIIDARESKCPFGFKK